MRILRSLIVDNVTEDDYRKVAMEVYNTYVGKIVYRVDIGAEIKDPQDYILADNPDDPVEIPSSITIVCLYSGNSTVSVQTFKNNLVNQLKKTKGLNVDLNGINLKIKYGELPSCEILYRSDYTINVMTKKSSMSKQDKYEYSTAVVLDTCHNVELDKYLNARISKLKIDNEISDTVFLTGDRRNNKDYCVYAIIRKDMKKVENRHPQWYSQNTETKGETTHCTFCHIVLWGKYQKYSQLGSSSFGVCRFCMHNHVINNSPSVETKAKYTVEDIIRNIGSLSDTDKDILSGLIKHTYSAWECTIKFDNYVGTSKYKLTTNDLKYIKPDTILFKYKDY